MDQLARLYAVPSGSVSAALVPWNSGVILPTASMRYRVSDPTVWVVGCVARKYRLMFQAPPMFHSRPAGTGSEAKMVTPAPSARLTGEALAVVCALNSASVPAGPVALIRCTVDVATLLVAAWRYVVVANGSKVMTDHVLSDTTPPGHM